MSEQKQQEKVYVDGLWIKNHKFNDGGEILKVSILVDKFQDFLKKYKKEDGFVNILIKERKQVKENGESHYGELDTWRPNNGQSAPAPKTAAPAKTNAVTKKSKPAPESDGNDF